MSPAPVNASVVNLDVLSSRAFLITALDSIALQLPLMTSLVQMDGLYKFFDPKTLAPRKNRFEKGGNHEERHDEHDEGHDHGNDHNHDHRSRRLSEEHKHQHHAQHDDDSLESYRSLDNSPHTVVFQPILDTLNPNAEETSVVSFILMITPWDRHFLGILPEGTNKMDAVLTDSCGSTYTYALEGTEAFLRGRGDLHNQDFNHVVVEAALGNNEEAHETLEGEEGHDHEHCVYRLFIYPTMVYKDGHKSNRPLFYATGVVCVFIFTASVFALYDFAVQRRQKTVLQSATQTKAIVTSLFPEAVQRRILGASNKERLSDFLHGLDDFDGDSKPIADLYLSTTVIFMDICGFTSWSSTREPPQVFTLLESVYKAFDGLAKKSRVFKVETIGDCYVACVGCPDKRDGHAVVMARYARKCMVEFHKMVKQLVVKLGPDTEDLGLRVGIHSGPITAGVLRGERARFQLFGDTVNTAARIEQTCLPNKIQVSKETANHLEQAGKSWCTMRDDKVAAKGIGELTTFWLKTDTASGFRADSETDSEEGEPATQQGDGSKTRRLVEWNTGVLSNLLKQVIAMRESLGIVPDNNTSVLALEKEIGGNPQVLDEVQEVVTLRQFYEKKSLVDPSTVTLNDNVKNQLENYVRALALKYRSNPFHNFEHASHVTMSVMKLLSRIVAPELDTSSSEKLHDHILHDHTYGITSDPLTQFAVVLSALIHDLDHPGVPNSQLVKEETTLATYYKEKSVAEQNSVVLSWELLMNDQYKDLRRAIYVTKSDFIRFRHLVVNVVLATDIMDKDLKALRNNRWDHAFNGTDSEDEIVAQNRKATIVMEHLIQASDVAHTMQHWHVYRKWNKRLFEEMYLAYLSGRAEKNPAESWYKGEIGFLDFYVIPLAKKLKDCGVFGVSSDEYLQYAMKNKIEWQAKGEAIVAEMMEHLRNKHTDSGSGTRGEKEGV